MDDNSKTDFDCFYASIIDDFFGEKTGTFLRTDYLTPYCLRPTLNDFPILIEGNVETATTFKSLRSQQISSKQLFEWSISINIIEQYTMYLSTNDTKFDEIIFYNCSSSWFGSHCQYTFGSNILIKSFGEFLVSSFNNRKKYLGKIIINTCYPHLSECYRGPEPMCLDWREICDGKIDCIGNNYGLDEQYCEELEINECKQDEYRCQNGAQCIPFDFYYDGIMSQDCLDGTDEDDTNNLNGLPCIASVTFRCEERICYGRESFACGDGDCLGYFAISVFVSPRKAVCEGTGRDLYYLQAVYSTGKYLSIDCYKFLFCTLKFNYILPNDTYDKNMCLPNNWLLSNNCSMEFLPFPPQPLFHHYFQLIYSLERLVHNASGKFIILPNYICNDPRSCLHLPNTTFKIGGLICRSTEQIIKPGDYFLDSNDITTLLTRLSPFCSLMGNNNENYRSKSSLFYCKLSDKYISKHRRIDGIVDCLYQEDEMYFDPCLFNHSLRSSCTSKNKCLPTFGIGDSSFPICVGAEDKLIGNSQESIFRLLCNGIQDQLLSGEDRETDESNCEWWPCNNPYTRCDGVLQCANGIDEIDCPKYDCSVNELKCYFEDTISYRCLTHAHIYEKPINCSDYHDGKPIRCRQIFYSNNFTNNKNEYLSWKRNSCITKHDITGCKSNNDQHLTCSLLGDIFFPYCDVKVFNMDSKALLCYLSRLFIPGDSARFFYTLNLGYLPSIINTTSLSSQEHISTKTMKIEEMNNSIELIKYCNRGIVIFEGKSYKKKCLCSPSYFGNQCQWQNQRISLTLRIRKLVSWEKKFFIYEIFIFLIDDKYQRIDSYEKIQYIPSIDCETKFNRYLIYSIRPKHINSNYSIHIDIYDKMTLDYYGSWYLFLPFQFLPVNRLSTQLLIPPEKSESFQNCSLECGVHGKCFYYINSSKSFCKCDQKYSGRFCNLTYQCSCSADSICLNSSICLCPLNKFGSKCYIQSEFCQPNNPCKNNGKCIPINDRIKKHGFICLCTEDYTGSNCEYKSNRIDLTFKTDIIPSIIYAHFITGFQNKKHERTTKFKKVPFDQYSITLLTSQPFHILFIEFFNNYYLSVLRETFIPSEYISTDIKTDNICVNTTKLFNSSILNFPELRRLKYYQLLCIQNSKLKCFYDEKHMCICDKNRYSNCFEFNHNITYTCQGYNYCENNGTCFQDNATCPTTSICMCDKCYYGSKCQLDTKGFSLSLDVIFGYYIKPSVSFFKQSKSVKITASITILIFTLGLISGSLSILTFKRKGSVVVGCGIYLLTASIISLLSISIFTIKYCQLVLFQMNSITNDSFIYLSCLLTDMLLKVLLCSGDWLNACVAIERALTAIQGVSFNKAKSRYIAKCIIPILLLLITASYIHDPISRRIFHDKDEQRTWCIVNYSLKLKIFDKIINLFHFLTPFIINFFSALIIIIQVFRTRSRSQPNVTRKSLLFAQIKRHKHLLISPCITMLLVLPRLIISLTSRCMESPRDPWLLLTGYYISSVPPLLISVIFILPSEKYTDEFLTVIRRKRTTAK